MVREDQHCARLSTDPPQIDISVPGSRPSHTDRLRSQVSAASVGPAVTGPLDGRLSGFHVFLRLRQRKAHSECVNVTLVLTFLSWFLVEAGPHAGFANIRRRILGVVIMSGGMWPLWEGQAC